MHDHAEYCGPVQCLVGKTAIVKPDESYHLPLEDRTLLAQFDSTELKHPQSGENLGFGWHTFPASHFKILVTV